MKLLNTIIYLIAAIQLIQPLAAAAASNKTLTYKAQLVHFYENEVNNLSLKYCIKFKNISEQIAKNELVQKARTPLMQEFKANITQYQEMYTLYTRLGLNKALLSAITHNLVKYYYRTDQDSQKILQILQSLGYSKMLDQFERDFMKFISTKFLPKFETFERLIPSNETADWQKVLQWGKKLKACKSYECVYKLFVHFDNIILSAREQLFAHINQQIIKINLFYFNGTNQVVQGVLKHPKLTQLSRQTQQVLVKNLQQFNRQYVSNRNLSKFNEMFEYAVPPFVENDQIPAQDGQLLKEIFTAQGYQQMRLNYKKKYQKFVDVELLKEFDRFMGNLSKNDLVQEGQLIAAIKRFKSLKSFAERRIALMDIMNRFYGTGIEKQ